MTTKDIIIAIFWGIAIGLFVGVGLNVFHSSTYNLIAIGLGCTVAGFALDRFWKTA